MRGNEGLWEYLEGRFDLEGRFGGMRVILMHHSYIHFSKKIKRFSFIILASGSYWSLEVELSRCVLAPKKVGFDQLSNTGRIDEKVNYSFWKTAYNEWIVVVRYLIFVAIMCKDKYVIRHIHRSKPERDGAIPACKELLCCGDLVCHHGLQ